MVIFSSYDDLNCKQYVMSATIYKTIQRSLGIKKYWGYIFVNVFKKHESKI